MKLTLLILLFGLVSMSSGLKCQVCDGQCINENDNGESKECDYGLSSCWYLKTNQGVIGRLCGPKLAEQCVTDDYFGFTVCNCDTDNCNKDNLCDCNFSNGLQCQVCDGEGGQCSSPSDNGKSVTCAADQDACFYQSIRNEDEEIVYRSCLNNAGVGDECLNLDHDEIGITDCFCTTDNCNKDDQCNC